MIEVGTEPKCPRCRQKISNLGKKDMIISCDKCKEEVKIFYIERQDKKHESGGLMPIKDLYICAAEELRWMKRN